MHEKPNGGCIWTVALAMGGLVGWCFAAATGSALWGALFGLAALMLVIGANRR